MIYLVIEHFRNDDPCPVYARFREQGRLAPEGLHDLDSWVTTDLATCYQVMACEDRALLQAWVDRWKDLVDFEVHPVMTSAEAREAVTAGTRGGKGQP